MADFNKAFDRVLGHEGGYVNAPLDRGKETYKGISRAMNSGWSGWTIVDVLRKEPGFPRNLENNAQLQNAVRDFYELEFWDACQGDMIHDQSIAEELFDTAVNMGVKISIKFAQHALNLLNRNGRSFADIGEDGIMGNESIKQINAFEEPAILLRALNALQASRYIKICELDSSQEEFFRGWLKRAS